MFGYKSVIYYDNDLLRRIISWMVYTFLYINNNKDNLIKP